MADLTAELIRDPSRLEELAPAWDALAVACRQPLAAPAWKLGAWRHMPPAKAELHAVAVHEGRELVAVAPLMAEPKGAGRVDLRALGAPMAGTPALAAPGREWEVAGPLAAALAEARGGDVLAFESSPLLSHWPVALAARWPGSVRPPLRRYLVQPALFVSLTDDSLENWIAGKGRHFRKRMRALWRRFPEAGGTIRAATPETFDDDVETFMDLHASRWVGRASALVEHRAELTALYRDVAREHLAEGRLRLYVLELEGEPIAAELFAAAGGEVTSLNGGFDERHARLGPSHVAILHAIGDGIARGDARLDLGPGTQDFKVRFADGDDPVAWTLLLVPRPRLPLTLARVTPTVARITAREAARRALTPERVDRLRALRSRALRARTTGRR